MRDVFKDYVFLIIMFQFFWLFFWSVAIFLEVEQTQLRMANILWFFIDWGRKIGGNVFLRGHRAPKLKRRGKNNHFYNAKSEAEATGNSNSLQSASGKMSDSKWRARNLLVLDAKFNSDFDPVQFVSVCLI